MYEVYRVFLKRCEEYFLCSFLPPEGVNSVGQHLTLERDIYLRQFHASQQESRKLVFNYLMNRESCITAADLNKLDLLEIGSYTELPGGNITLPSGFSSLLKPLAKDIPPEKIIKGQPVDVVRWSPGVNGGRSSNVKKVEVVCDSGETYLADSVICTVPLGILKLKHLKMFQPSLPSSKVQSLEKLTFGVVDKIYLEYERPFFSPELQELILLWEDVEDESSDISERWFRKIYSFSKLSDTLLLAWVSGEEAKYMETLPFETVGEKCTEILRQFLDDPCVPEPKRCIW